MNETLSQNTKHKRQHCKSSCPSSEKRNLYAWVPIRTKMVLRHGIVSWSMCLSFWYMIWQRRTKYDQHCQELFQMGQDAFSRLYPTTITVWVVEITWRTKIILSYIVNTIATCNLTTYKQTCYLPFCPGIVPLQHQRVNNVCSLLQITATIPSSV